MTPPQPYGKLLNPRKPPAPFKVSIPESELQDFKTLLRLSRIPSPTYESLRTDRSFGVSHEWMTAAKTRWLDGFDWRRSEESINSFPAFISKVEVEVEGEGGKGEKEEFDIHWTGLLSEKKDAVPILLLHGWPGSFLEFLPILSLFRDQYTPQTLPYHLIVTSMPGYSFSAPPPLHRELGIWEVPRIFNQLMNDLGFGAGYVAQGGDIGSRIARLLAVQYEECKAVHLNFCPVQQPPGSSEDTLSPKEKEGLARSKTFMADGRAYQQIHATRPSTLGLILGSNPLATLAWIGEKYLEWSDDDPDLDTILEAGMLYWLTESGGKSVYPYRQKLPSGKTPSEVPEQFFIKQPLGCSYFPKELVPFPREWAATTGNVVFYRQHDKGGHFAALEQPRILKKDIENFIDEVWKK